MLPPTRLQHNIILFELDFDENIPLLHLLQFLSDLKSIIYCQKYISNFLDIWLKGSKENIFIYCTKFDDYLNL